MSPYRYSDSNLHLQSVTGVTLQVLRQQLTLTVCHWCHPIGTQTATYTYSLSLVSPYRYSDSNIHLQSVTGVTLYRYSDSNLHLQSVTGVTLQVLRQQLTLTVCHWCHPTGTQTATYTYSLSLVSPYTYSDSNLHLQSVTGVTLQVLRQQLTLTVCHWCHPTGTQTATYTYSLSLVSPYRYSDSNLHLQSVTGVTL